MSLTGTVLLPDMFEPHAELSVPNRRRYMPMAPQDLDSAGLTEALVDGLVLKFLLSNGETSGRRVAQQVCLPFKLTTAILSEMRIQKTIVYKKSSGLNDFEYELTSAGAEKAERLINRTTYFGAAPVSIQDYRRSVIAQSPRNERPTQDSLRKALAGLSVKKEVFHQLGQAVTSMGSLFLWGKPGNGKTSIAERLTASFGESIWLPRAINIDGEIVRVYDPTVHYPSDERIDSAVAEHVDRRWVWVKRPTVVVGGELTLESLELTLDKSTGILEAPVHLKSNCGTIVIDDFGRQRCSTDALLNRWIIPLEKKYDFLNTPGGKKVQVPFEQLVAFATNLEPKQLVDEAFLRRIPYKIEAVDPTEAEFRKIWAVTAQKLELPYDEASLDDLIRVHYREANRPFRYCHPRDLLSQVKTWCEFLGHPPCVSSEALDASVRNYFAL